MLFEEKKTTWREPPTSSRICSKIGASGVVCLSSYTDSTYIGGRAYEHDYTFLEPRPHNERICPRIRKISSAFSREWRHSSPTCNAEANFCLRYISFNKTEERKLRGSLVLCKSSLSELDELDFLDRSRVHYSGLWSDDFFCRFEKIPLSCYAYTVCVACGR
jgi:hypothetical protein